MSFGEYCALYLDVWSNAGWEVDGRQADVPDARADLQRSPRSPRSSGTCTAASRADELSAHERRRPACARYGQARAREAAAPTQRINTLTTFFDSLPRVRRALANVPTYMVFDDHDVTDDWNISRAWRDQVYTSPLGRRIVTGALAAYALFQDWGNDPLRLPPEPAQARAPCRPRSCSRRARPTRRSTAREALRPQPVRPRASPGHRGQLALADRRAQAPRGRARHAHAARVPLALRCLRAALVPGAERAAPRPGDRAAAAGHGGAGRRSPRPRSPCRRSRAR